jgi:hypothetical protein
MPSGKTEGNGLHRLTDMDVDEVSFVDRGANRKRFLVVKNDGEGDAMARELASDGRGGYRTLKAAKETPADEEEDKKDKKKPPFGGNKAPPFQSKPKKAEDEEDDDEEDEEDDEEDDTSKAAGKKPNDEEDEDDDAMAKKGAMKKAALETLMECIDMLVGAAEELKDSDDDDVEMSASSKKSLGDVVGKLDKLCGKTDVGKAGRRMSKERLDRFEKVVSDLSSILKEVMSSPELKDTEKRSSELLKRVSKLLSGEGGSHVDELAAVVEDLQIEVQKGRKEIALLKKAAGSGGSNSTTVEKSDRSDRRKGNDEVEWPFDLNNPMTRDRTAKDFSFYED